MSKTRVPYFQDQLVITVEITHWDSDEIMVTMDEVISGELMGTLTCDWLPVNFTEHQELAIESAARSLLRKILTKYRTDMKVSGQLGILWGEPAREGETS